MEKALKNQILKAFEMRLKNGLLEPQGAIRLFNGFYEGTTNLVIDRYAETLVLFNQADPPEELSASIPEIQEILLERLPGIQSVLVKTRFTPDIDFRKGIRTFGKALAAEISENDIRYALDLQMNQDASFYLDTRNLRAWLKQRAAGWSVLNCFAYTGSLGAAALAGGAQRVLQLDLSRKFLSLARRTYALNGFTVRRQDFLVGDFFRLAGRLRHENAGFDCVILDAPFFSTSAGSSLNTEKDTARLINKIRPLVKDGGWLVAVNNSLFLSGSEYLHSIKDLEQDGCVELVGTIPVPEDVRGYPDTTLRHPPANPAPFNHPTKIAILKIKKKSPD